MHSARNRQRTTCCTLRCHACPMHSARLRCALPPQGYVQPTKVEHVSMLLDAPDSSAKLRVNVKHLGGVDGLHAGAYVCVIGQLRASQPRDTPGQQASAKKPGFHFVLAHKARPAAPAACTAHGVPAAPPLKLCLRATGDLPGQPGGRGRAASAVGRGAALPGGQRLCIAAAAAANQHSVLTAAAHVGSPSLRHHRRCNMHTY